MHNQHRYPPQQTHQQVLRQQQQQHQQQQQPPQPQVNPPYTIPYPPQAQQQPQQQYQHPSQDPHQDEDHQHDDHPEEDEEAPRRKLGKVDRGREACNECRRHKIRCHPRPDDPQHQFPCSRCERMEITCEFAKHNRGRKRKRPLPLLASDSQAPPVSSALQASNSATASASRQPSESISSSTGQTPRLQLPPISLGDPRFPFISNDPDLGAGPPELSPSSLKNKARLGAKLGFKPIQEEDYSNSHGRIRPHPQMSLRHMIGEDSSDRNEDEFSDREDERTATLPGGSRSGQGRNHHHVYSHSNETGGRNVTGRHTLSESPIRTKAEASGGKGPGLADDPISAGVLDETDARALFDLFMTSYNTSNPMMDPVIHTHDHVRRESPFLYTAIISASRNRHISPEYAQSVHQQILVLARDHMTWTYADAIASVDVIIAMITLGMHKEPDDDKAWYHISRAILLGKELNLGRIPSRAETEQYTEEEHRHLRSRQRLWISLFVVNSVFSMQFRQPMLILQSDPLIATVTHWLKRARPDTLLIDTLATCTVELRRKFLHYRDLLIGSGSEEPVYRSALFLSTLTRTMNQDWDITSAAWIRDIIDVGGTSSHINKPRILTSSLRLNLNLLIVNQTLRLPPEEQVHFGAPDSIPAFHHCLNAATTVLVRIESLNKSQITFASDTFLHFALYAATLLSTLCRGQHPYKLESVEIDHCRRLILKTADILDAASDYPSDSPTLHAWYLRRLCQLLPSADSQNEMPAVTSEDFTLAAGGISSTTKTISAHDRNPFSRKGTTTSPSSAGAPPATSTRAAEGARGASSGILATLESTKTSLPADVTSYNRPNQYMNRSSIRDGDDLRNPNPIDVQNQPHQSSAVDHIPVQTLPAITTTMPVDPALTTVMGNELDFFLGDFPWVGLDSTLDQIQTPTYPNLLGMYPNSNAGAGSYAGMPPSYGQGMWQPDMSMSGTNTSLEARHTAFGQAASRNHHQPHSANPVEMPYGGPGPGVGVAGMNGQGGMGYGTM